MSLLPPKQGFRVFHQALVALGPFMVLLPAAGLSFVHHVQDRNGDIPGYTNTSPHDAITRLQEQIDKGLVTLPYDNRLGYLPAVLKQLRIPTSSQALVFSKTSVHKDRISPQTPRALYFNDATYVGWVPHVDVVEFATLDLKLGAVFYSLSQQRTARPRFVRKIKDCLPCHGGSFTDRVPGFVMRSVYPDAEGEPESGAATYLTIDASPLKERWGGWYVTGTHGSQRHMGNGFARVQGDIVTMDMDAGANLTDLKRRVDTSPYLSRHSDIVALMVMEHQTHLQNLIIKASYQTRGALHAEQAFPREPERSAGARSDSTESRVAAACEPLVRAMLFVGEVRLTAPIRGTSGFAEQFSARGPRDRRNRSLRELDLKQRLLRYPCSYMIYSEAFDSLPALAKEYVYRRLWEVLSGQDRSSEFTHLTQADRKATLQILLETKPAFAAWKANH